eukprot:Amastigsp_a176275_33.p2 type:complete len:267 gc:universal Amastigsp_a176275_33:833-33(-)
MCSILSGVMPARKSTRSRRKHFGSPPAMAAVSSVCVSPSSPGCKVVHASPSPSAVGHASSSGNCIFVSPTKNAWSNDSITPTACSSWSRRYLASSAYDSRCEVHTQSLRPPERANVPTTSRRSSFETISWTCTVKNGCFENSTTPYSRKVDARASETRYRARTQGSWRKAARIGGVTSCRAKKSGLSASMARHWARCLLTTAVSPNQMFQETILNSFWSRGCGGRSASSTTHRCAASLNAYEATRGLYSSSMLILRLRGRGEDAMG